MQAQEAFKTGRLLLDTQADAQVAPLSGTPTILMMALVCVSVVLVILFLERFLRLLPLLADSIFRARGSNTLENSVGFCADRNLFSLVLLLPALLIIFRYRLYDAVFLRDLSPDARLLALSGVFGAFLLLRLLLYLWCKPRRGADYYQRSYRAGHTYFILGMLLVLLTVGILALIRLPETTIRWVIYSEAAVVCLLFWLRRAQILSLSCNPFRTFLYLCGLEILPLTLLVVSAVLL